VTRSNAQPGTQVRFSYKDIMAPSIGKTPFDRAGWIFELKYDGYRAIVGKHKGEMKMLSRRGNDFLPYFPEIAARLETLPDMVLDGELVVLDDQGRAQFEPLRRRALMRNPKSIVAASRETPAAVFAFDLIALRGHDLRRYPLTMRKAMLKDVLKDSTRIRCVTHIGENGVRLFQAACELRVEGIVAKRADSPYGRGRTSDWVKIRTPAGMDIQAERAKWNEDTR
jgi:bifunctional non-homologous end joining protein LigD